MILDVTLMFIMIPSLYVSCDLMGDVGHEYTAPVFPRSLHLRMFVARRGIDASPRIPPPLDSGMADLSHRNRLRAGLTANLNYRWLRIPIAAVYCRYIYEGREWSLYGEPRSIVSHSLPLVQLF